MPALARGRVRAYVRHRNDSFQYRRALVPDVPRWVWTVAMEIVVLPVFASSAAFAEEVTGGGSR
ncbi:hypothetical protein [Streptomyces sp. NPDC046727]|uniref:hypothetical protein n=1 Tax=Streptomyces sp. NPDC046727 TaxID=3155373 RepID=UPI0033FFC4B2